MFKYSVRRGLPAGVGGAASREELVAQFHLDALWNIQLCISLEEEEEEEEGLMVH